jgi:hypothetical protein
LSKQEKRIKKELEKHWRAGRCWEWLALVEKENLRRDFGREEQEAWKNLIKRAFRLPANLLDFWSHLPEIKNPPQTPEIQCLRILGDFAADRDVADRLATLKNLPFPAEAFRQKALSWKEDLFPEKKIREIFNTFIHNPEKITGKFYGELSGLLDQAPVAAAIASMGTKIDVFRRLNRKIKGAKRIGPYRLLGELTAADSHLKGISGAFSGPLQELLFYPFLFQLAVFFQSQIPRADGAYLLSIASAVPFLFLRAAGEKREEFQKCFLGAGRTLSGPDRSFLDRVASGGSIEEKASLLVRLRSLLKEDTGYQYLNPFRDLYRGLLLDLANQSKNLSAREKRELAQVVNDQVLLDLPMLLDCFDNFEDIADLLRPVVEIGMSSGKLAVIALILAETLREKDLKKQVQDALRNQGGPKEEDLFWALDIFPDLVFPEVSLLRPFLEMDGGAPPFLPALVERVHAEIQIMLFGQALSRTASDFLSPGFDRESEDFKIEYQLWRRELAALSPYPSFTILREILSCYSEGYFTEAGFRRFLDLLAAKNQGLDWLGAYLQDRNGLFSKLRKARDFSPFDFSPEDLLEKIKSAILPFLEERFGDLKTAAPETIETLADLLLEKPHGRGKANLLVRFSNLLGERSAAGETRFQPLQERIQRRLIEYKKGFPGKVPR